MLKGNNRCSGRLVSQFRVAMALASMVAVAACTLFPATGDRGTAASAPGIDWAKRTVVGYVAYWDQERGFDVVREHFDLFDEVSPFWYSLDARGAVVPADDRHTRIDPADVRSLQRHGTRVIPTITNLRNGTWNPRVVSEMLHNRATRDAHIRHIVDLAVRRGYDGIDIDYEGLGANDREAYSSFLRELGRALHAKDKMLTSSVHPKQSEPGRNDHNKAQNYHAIGAAVDQVRVMTYDYHWSTSPPGPVAPADWVEDVIAWTVTQVPSEKVYLGIVLLGYDWEIGGHGKTVSYQRATALARRHDAPVRHHGRGGSPTFTYRDMGGSKHEVWFEDATSAGAKLALVKKYDLGGVFFWRLGGENPQVWSLLQPKPRAVPAGR